jgi:hypothetical protein
MSSVIGGAMLPHAPQFFTMPETEYRDTVERVSDRAEYRRWMRCRVILEKKFSTALSQDADVGVK